MLTSLSPWKLCGPAKMAPLGKNVLTVLVNWIFWYSMCSKYKDTNTHTLVTVLLRDDYCLLLFADIHRLHSSCSQPLSAAAHLHHRASADVHRPAPGWIAATRLCHRGQLLFQHAAQPKEPVLRHQVCICSSQNTAVMKVCSNVNSYCIITL